MLKVMLGLSFLMTGCVFGPFEVTHEYGYKPKFHVNTGIDQIKFRAKRREFYIKFEEEF